MATQQPIRPLKQDEDKQIWLQIQQRWGATPGGWYPVTGLQMPQDVIAFQDEWFYHSVPLGQLKSILKAHGITRIYELREGPESAQEMDCDSLDLYYDGTEGYWTSASIDWLIYASHEHSLTIAGAWLIAAIKALWPRWQEHLYTLKN